MELSYDWKNFQSFFYSKRKSAASELLGPIYLVTDRKVIVSALSEGEDLSDWIGATYDELLAEASHRQFILFDRTQVDQSVGKACSLKHYYDQIRFLQNEAKPTPLVHGKVKSAEVLLPKHFLLFAIQSWWSKFLPSTYGIYIRLKGEMGEQSLFITVQKKQVLSFQVPDLSSMIPDRRKHPQDVVRFLSERYLVPVQGIYLTDAEWAEWSEMANPWGKIFSAVKVDHSKLMPFKWGLFLLLGLRAYFGI